MGFSLSPLHTNSLMRIIWSNNDDKAPKTINITLQISGANLSLVMWFFHSTKSHCMIRVSHAFHPNLRFKCCIQSTFTDNLNTSQRFFLCFYECCVIFTSFEVCIPFPHQPLTLPKESANLFPKHCFFGTLESPFHQREVSTTTTQLILWPRHCGEKVE